MTATTTAAPAPAPRPRRRARVLLIVFVVAAVLVGVAAVLVTRAVPDYRTAFLVDASLPEDGKDFTAIANAVGSAARNSADDDSLALRRFGGSCGDRANTSSVVGAGTGQAQKISASASALKPSGKATLESGLLAAIDDFSGYYPFRGSERNRVIVVTSHGTDACTTDRAALQRAVREKARDAGVRLDFRFVGYKVPRKEQRPLATIATAGDAPEPRFVTTPAELNKTLIELTIPPSPDLKSIKTPPTTPQVSGPPPAPLADGLHYVHVRRVDAEAGTLTVDELTYFTGEAAHKAAREDGIPNLQSDVYLRNPDEKTVRVKVAPNARLIINQLDIEHSGDSSYSRKVSLKELSDKLAETTDRMRRKDFKLTMSNGQVTELHENWYP